MTKRWRALVASMASAALFCLFAWAAFGTQTWVAFFHSLHYTRTIVLEQGVPGWEKFQTLFAAARIWGFSVDPAIMCQFANRGVPATLIIKAAALMICLRRGLSSGTGVTTPASGSVLQIADAPF